MDKQRSTYLGYGLLALALMLYGIHKQKKWPYYVLTMLFVAPLGGTIGFALGNDKKEDANPHFTQPTLPNATVSDYQFDPLLSQ